MALSLTLTLDNYRRLFFKRGFGHLAANARDLDWTIWLFFLVNSLRKCFPQKEHIGFNRNPDSCLRRNDVLEFGS